MKKLAGILAVLMVLSLLSGCAAKTDQQRFVGTWETNLDWTDAITEAMAQSPELAEYIQIDDFGMKVLFTFRSDGTYRMEGDIASFEESYEALVTDMQEGLYAYLETVIGEMGLGMSVEEFLSMSGISLGELFDDAMSDTLDKDDLQEMFEEMQSEGTYRAEDGKLYLADNEEDYITYEFQNDQEATLLEGFGEEATQEDELQQFYPLKLTKQ